MKMAKKKKVNVLATVGVPFSEVVVSMNSAGCKIDEVYL
jgi:hypothetical protein